MNWYYVEAGQQMGPVDDAGLNALVASGRINADTLIWREGMANWQAYREIHPAAAAPPLAAPAAGGLRINRGPAAAASAPTAADPGAGGEAVCAECGGVFPVSDTIQIGEARVCANCKPVFVQKMREGINVGVAGSLRYAGFWIRLGAKLLDGIILAVVIFVPLLVIAFSVGLNAAHSHAGNFGADPGGLVPHAAGDPGEPNAFAAFFSLFARFLAIAVNAVFSMVFIGKWGATPGKMACGLRVVQADGSKVGYGRAFGRGAAEFLSQFICDIGYIMAAFDPEKRALHDRMCATRVVYK